jgi:hypothetical protein
VPGRVDYISCRLKIAIAKHLPFSKKLNGETGAVFYINI